MIENLRLTESATYFKITHESKGQIFLPKTLISSLFDEFVKAKKGTTLFKRSRIASQIGSKNVYYSICLFSFTAMPAFLKDAGIEYKETNIGFLLLVEYNEYLAVSKKYIDDFEKWISSFAVAVEPHIINNYRLDDKSRIERLVMKSADQGRGAIKEKAIEADEVENTYAPVGAERQMVNSYRLNTGKASMNFSSRTSHITVLGSKGDFNRFLERLTGEIDLIKAYKHKANYLDHFAEYIPLKVVSKVADPLLVMISMYELTQQLHAEGENITLKIKQPDGSEKELEYQKICNALSCTFLVKPSGQTMSLEMDPLLLKSLPLEFQKIVSGIRLVQLATKFRLDGSGLSSITAVIGSNNPTTLLSLINDRNLLHINYNIPDYVYSMGQVHREKDYSKRAELVTDILIKYDGLKLTKREKYAAAPITVGLTDFDSDSVFHFIETSDLTSNSTYLICDDLGNEWADYISIETNNRIRYFHAKSGNITNGASKFHDVVSQALKNIGNMRSYALLDVKCQSWKGNYGDANFTKVRKKNLKGATLQDISNAYKECVLNNNAIFECWLVVDFLSLDSLEKSIEKFKKTGKMSNYTMQLISLLLKYISACRESNIVPRVACRP